MREAHQDASSKRGAWAQLLSATVAASQDAVAKGGVEWENGKIRMGERIAQNGRYSGHMTGSSGLFRQAR